MEPGSPALSERRPRSGLAQLVEQLTVNQRVVGSSPTSGEFQKPYNVRLFSLVKPSSVPPCPTRVSTVLAKPKSLSCSTAWSSRPRDKLKLWSMCARLLLRVISSESERIARCSARNEMRIAAATTRGAGRGERPNARPGGPEKSSRYLSRVFPFVRVRERCVTRCCAAPSVSTFLRLRSSVRLAEQAALLRSCVARAALGLSGRCAERLRPSIRSGSRRHTMRTSRLVRCALNCCVAAGMLAGCGGHTVNGVVPSSGVPNSSVPHHKSFYYTGGAQDFTVPAGVRQLNVIARGARSAGSFAAHGGRVHAVIPVTPGEKLVVYVGGDASGMAGGFKRRRWGQAVPEEEKAVGALPTSVRAEKAWATGLSFRVVQAEPVRRLATYSGRHRGEGRRRNRRHRRMRSQSRVRM